MSLPITGGGVRGSSAVNLPISRSGASINQPISGGSGVVNQSDSGSSSSTNVGTTISGGSSSGITPPLIIKSESKAAPMDKAHKAPDSSAATKCDEPLVSDPVYPTQKHETSLECVAKQLCQNELMVVTTIYCLYTGEKNLPDDLKIAGSFNSEESASSSSVDERASKRRRLDSNNTSSSSSEENLPNMTGYSLSEIEAVLERVDKTPYSAEMTTFIHNLVANTDNGPHIVETLCKLLEKRVPGVLFISVLLVRSLAKYLAVQLTNIGPRECLEDLPEYRLTVETQKLLSSFGVLFKTVYCR